MNHLPDAYSPIAEPLERQVAALTVLEQASHWPADAELTVAALQRMAPGAERISLSGHARAVYFWNPAIDELFAQDLMALGEISAWGALRTAVEQNPAYLPRRQRLVELYEHAAARSPTQRDLLLQLARAERQRIAELAPIVHPRNRLLKPPTSGLPIQPAP